MSGLLGQRIGHYRVDAFLGAGGMGTVYRARDERLDRDVALKILPADLRGDETARARLLREARTASALNHPNIAHVYEVGEAGEHLFLAMELVDGRTLQKVIPAEGLPPEALLRHALEIAEALDEAHDHGVVHRDLKSTNIMITGSGVVKVLDFGLAKRIHGQEAPTDLDLTSTGMVVGTPNHMPPEILRGAPADARSDIWSFGVVLYEMACGRYPFHGASIGELAKAIVGDTPKPLTSRVPIGVQAVIARCLAKEPAQRYRDGGEVRAALEALLGVADRRRRRVASRRPWVAAAIALVVVLGAAFALTPGRLPPRPPVPGATPATAEIRSLAVLPLANLSGDPAQEYFADGMTEELITNLAPIPSLKVISRTSVMRYKDSKESLQAIAKALGVDTIVEGSVQRDGDRVRITAQLIEAATDRHLWARSFDRDYREILALQTEVSQEIARAVSRELTPAVAARLAAPRTVDPRVYELILKGRHEWGRISEEGMRRAADYFEQALAIDPGDPRASAGLADVYLLRVQVLGSMPQKEGMPKVKEYARRALAADPQSAEAHSSNAAALLFGDWDFAGAESEILRAIELNPGYAPAHLVHSVILLTQSRVPEAIAADRRALELDPMSILVYWNAVNTLRVAHRYDEAVAMAQRGIAHLPEAGFLYSTILHVYEQQENYDAALRLLEGHLPPEEGGPAQAARMRKAYETGGAAGYWRAALETVGPTARKGDGQPVALAYMHAHLGDRKNALRYLEEAYERRLSDVLFIRSEPVFVILHDEPGYQELVRKVGFPDPRTN